MEKIKLGIIGCGRHALQSHAIPCKTDSGLELVSICDVSKQSLAKFEAEFGKDLEKFTSESDFLLSGINAVLIGSPDEFHLTSLRQALENGKHVFVEKPLATKTTELNELKHLLDYASKKNLIVSSCHLRRFDPPYIWLKENMKNFQANLGKIVSFHFDFSYHKPSKTWKHERSLLLDHANHEIDLLHFIIGYDDFRVTKLADGFDYYHVFGKQKNGVVFEFKGTRRLESFKYLESTLIRFEKGELLLDSIDGFVRINNHETGVVETRSVPKTDYSLRGKRTTENFVKAINSQEKCYLTSQDLYINTATAVILSETENWDCEMAQNG
ncbi:Gfo/Idh/MocA family oxidoreductase [Candidatus Woesearchaeota archaeon]|nr:Gfo/Idh/MocA family oxidoreductase [Candidatus Woesearchaeota archaeon]